MPGRKTWVAGEILTASDLMDYLMDQVVAVVTSGTRPGSPEEGMVIYETDTNLIRVWDGASWGSLARSDIDSTFAADVTVNGDLFAGTLDVTGAVRFHVNGQIDGTFTVDDTLSVTGAAGFTSTIHVTGAATFDSTVAAGNTISATASGANSVSFSDNDAHTWESDGGGGWRFANRWGTAASLFTFVGGDNTTELLRITDPDSLDDTALWLSWQSHDTTIRVSQVRATQAGDIDGTTRRYLYVVET